MSRLERAARILDAARRWKEECLLGGGSLFGEGELWTLERFQELQPFVAHREGDGGSPDENFRIALEPASEESKRLLAEVVWVYFLLVSPTRVSVATRLDRLRTFHSWSGIELPEEHWALDVLDEGIVDASPTYLTYARREYVLVIHLMLDWFHPETERDSLMSDPWRFAAWVYDRAEARGRQWRHAVVYLLFPDEFEPVMSRVRKWDIAQAFRMPGDSSEIDPSDLIAIDRAVLAVRKGLEAEHPGQEVDFYASPWLERWYPGQRDDRAVYGDVNSQSDDEQWFRDRFGEADVWAIAPGEGARKWAEFCELGIAAIGWDYLGDLSEYQSRDAVHATLIENGAGKNPSMSSLAAWQFAHEVKVGDFLVAKQGRRTLLGWGVVRGVYEYEPERADYCHIRKVEWHAAPRPITHERPITVKTLTRFTSDKNWLRYAFGLLSGEAGPEPTNLPLPYPPEIALEELFLDKEQFDRILDSIASRKNLVLQGPPGVGKTFIARRIAWCLIGHKDASRVETVQFHQSYAYEDFVQGWRPTETGGFTLRNGVFFDFCKRAEEHPERTYVFIVDEINRGNLSRIFGELLMLIEADKRGAEHAIALTYSSEGERFSVPPNVHLLGLMNTADRSLAIVDYALRRRFAFETLQPAFGSEKFRSHLVEHLEMERDLVARIDGKLAALNAAIGDDKDLGRGFEIGHSYFVPDEPEDETWYKSVVETQIAPLLREYWFDRPDQAESRIKELLA